VGDDVQLFDRGADYMSETMYCLDIMAAHVSQTMYNCLDTAPDIMSETTYHCLDITADHVSRDNVS
jgi:hypothetical protein